MSTACSLTKLRTLVLQLESHKICVRQTQTDRCCPKIVKRYSGYPKRRKLMKKGSRKLSRYLYFHLTYIKKVNKRKYLMEIII